MKNLLKFTMVAAITFVSFLVVDFAIVDFAIVDLAIAATESSSSPNEEFIVGEKSARAPAQARRNGDSRKRYPGGADEDDLQVQATLPIPARNPDGTSSTTAEVPAEGASPSGTD